MGREAKIAVAEEVPRKPAIAQKLRSQSESFGLGSKSVRFWSFASGHGSVFYGVPQI